MSQYKLTVCIPTYNRAQLLEKACNLIIAQIVRDELVNEIQICISDNGSTDDTEEVVRRLQQGKCVNIKYCKQSENVGFSRNLLSVIEMADGEFVLLAADDDLLNEGALKLILDTIGLGFSVVIFGPPMPSGSLANSTSNAPTVINNALHVVEALGIFHISFIGNIVIRRDVYLQYHNPAFIPSAYPHTCVVLTALRRVKAVHLRTLLFTIDDSHRQLNQPLLSSVDMSKVQTDCLLQFGASRKFTSKVYMELVRSVPRAIARERTGRAVRNTGNPYANLSLGNLFHCYRCSLQYQMLAAVFWITAKLMPLRVLTGLLKRSERA